MTHRGGFLRVTMRRTRWRSHKNANVKHAQDNGQLIKYVKIINAIKGNHKSLRSATKVYESYMFLTHSYWMDFICSGLIVLRTCNIRSNMVTLSG